MLNDALNQQWQHLGIEYKIESKDGTISCSSRKPRGKWKHSIEQEHLQHLADVIRLLLPADLNFYRLPTSPGLDMNLGRL